jgi:hypothetical protein
VVEIIGSDVGVTGYSVSVVVISIDVDDKNVVEVFPSESVVVSRLSVDTVISDVVLNGSLEGAVSLLCSVLAVVEAVDRGKLPVVVGMVAVLT